VRLPLWYGMGKRRERVVDKPRRRRQPDGGLRLRRRSKGLRAVRNEGRRWPSFPIRILAHR
jgi:hypothetical protein